MAKQKTNHTKAPSIPKSEKTAVAAKVKLSLQLLAIAGLLTLTGIAFFPMLQNQFTSWDDTVYITKNTRIWSLKSENLQYIFTQPIALNYHPFTMLSLALNYYYSKLNPFSYLLTNLVLHLFNVVLLYRFVYVLSRENFHVAAFTALLFAIHPMHVESVAWAAERKDVLYTFFFLASLITYLHFLAHKKWIYYILTLLLATFSMLSKPAAIILPLVLVALDFYKTGNLQLKSQLNKIPFLLLAAFFLYMTLVAQTTDNFVIGDFKKYGVPDRILFACYGLFSYFIKLFVPYQLSCFHPYPVTPGILVYASPLFLIALATAIYLVKEKRRLLLFGISFYVINLILVLQFFSVGDAVIAERYTYVPYIGLWFVAGMWLFGKETRVNKKIVWLATLVVSLIFSFQTHARVKVWHDTESLWTDVIKKYPNADIGYYNRGTLYTERDETEKALADYNRAIKNGTNSKAYVNRGNIFLKQYRYKEAIADFTAATKSNPLQYRGFLGLGRCYAETQQYDEALKNFNEALRLNPAFDAAYTGRGNLYLSMKQTEAAMADANKALSLREEQYAYLLKANIFLALQQTDQAINEYLNIEKRLGDKSIHIEIGNVYFNQKNYNKAIEEYSLVINNDPQKTIAYTNRAASYYLSNRFNEAIPDAEKSSSLDPKNPYPYTILEAIYRKMGDASKAAFYAEKARSLSGK